MRRVTTRLPARRRLYLLRSDEWPPMPGPAGCEDFATSRLTEVTDTAVPAGDTTRRRLMSQARLVGEI